MFGYDLPLWLVHSPAIEGLQFYATAHHVFDAYTKKGGGEAGAVAEGALAAGKGMAEEIPFVGGAGDIAKQTANIKAVGKNLGMAASRVLPPDVGKIARGTDVGGKFQFPGNIQQSYWPVAASGDTLSTTKRYPQTFSDELKMAIPGLREQVTDVKAKTRRRVPRRSR